MPLARIRVAWISCLVRYLNTPYKVCALAAVPRGADLLLCTAMKPHIQQGAPAAAPRGADLLPFRHLNHCLEHAPCSQVRAAPISGDSPASISTPPISHCTIYCPWQPLIYYQPHTNIDHSKYRQTIDRSIMLRWITPEDPIWVVRRNAKGKALASGGRRRAECR